MTEVTTSNDDIKKIKYLKLFEALSKINSLFTSPGIDKEGRGVLLCCLIEDMGRAGELKPRYVIEMKSLVIDYFTQPPCPDSQANPSSPS